MELNNNINNNSNKENFYDKLYPLIVVLGATIIITITLLMSLYLTKKENYKIINITNNELIYQVKNTLKTESINNLRITIDNSKETPILIKDSMGYKELLINEEDYNKYFKGE